jgi:hypothetical protein
VTRRYGIDFADLRLSGYHNPNELQPQHAQLHACETLFGDWDATVMLLAQDAANFSTLAALTRTDGKANPFRHNPGNRTNKNLYEVLESSKRFELGPYCDPNNRHCGLYYANAIWMLKASESMSGRLSDVRRSYALNATVFEATVRNLSKLKLIVTLGSHAFRFVRPYLDPSGLRGWHDSVLNHDLHTLRCHGQSYLVGTLYHTSVRGMIARARLGGATGTQLLEKGLTLTKDDLRELLTKAHVP